MTEFIVKEAKICRVAIFLNELLYQIYSVEIFEIINITNNSNVI